MKYDPLNEQHDLIITSKAILVAVMKLFAGYRTTEYYRFETPDRCRSWLELDVNMLRTKLCVFLPENDIRVHLPRSYYQDLLGAEPIKVGGWKNPPKFLVGELAVYCLNTYIPIFPIYWTSQGNDFCVIGGESYGLYRAIPTIYTENKE